MYGLKPEDIEHLKLLCGEPVSQVLQSALEHRLEVIEVAPRYDTLEDLFVRSGAGTEAAS